MSVPEVPKVPEDGDLEDTAGGRASRDRQGGRVRFDTQVEMSGVAGTAEVNGVSDDRDRDVDVRGEERHPLDASMLSIDTIAPLEGEMEMNGEGEIELELSLEVDLEVDEEGEWVVRGDQTQVPKWESRGEWGDEIVHHLVGVLMRYN